MRTAGDNGLEGETTETVNLAAMMMAATIGILEGTGEDLVEATAGGLVEVTVSETVGEMGAVVMAMVAGTAVMVEEAAAKVAGMEVPMGAGMGMGVAMGMATGMAMGMGMGMEVGAVMGMVVAEMITEVGVEMVMAALATIEITATAAIGEMATTTTTIITITTTAAAATTAMKVGVGLEEGMEETGMETTGILTRTQQPTALLNHHPLPFRHRPYNQPSLLNLLPLH